MTDENQNFKGVSVKDEFYLTNPTDHKFYKVVGLIMGAYALNTEKWGCFERPKHPLHLALYNLTRGVVITCVPMVFILQFSYLGTHFSQLEFKSLAVVFSMIPVTFLVGIKTGTAQTSSYKDANYALMRDIHLYNYLKVKEFDDEKRNYIAKELIGIEKNTRHTCNSLMTIVLICMVSWHTVPVIHNFQKTADIHNVTERLELCVHLWMPFDFEFNFYNCLAMQAFGFYCSVIAVSLMVLFDAVNFAFIHHLVGHIKIIKYDLKNGFKNTELTDLELKKKLIDVTKYYGFITKTFVMVQDAYGFSVASIYAQNLFQGGLLLYQLATEGKDIETILTFGLMIPIFMGTLMLVSVKLENVRIEAEDIPALVYDIPWESMSVSNQKMLLLILNQVQPTLEFVAAFNIKTGVQPALNIIKATFSYYVMIKDSQ